MTVLCGVDIETTGLDKFHDEIIEIAWVIKEHAATKPLVTRGTFCYSEKPITKKIFELTHIEPRHLEGAPEVGNVFAALLKDLEKHKVDYLVAHNGNFFDKPFMEEKGFVSDLPWIDTCKDIEYPSSFRHTNLTYVAASLGFVNPFPHAALFDVATMLKVLDQFPIGRVVDRGDSPDIVVEAGVNFGSKDLAKDQRFRWDKPTKTWLKTIKECDYQELVEKCDFPVTKV